METDGSFSSGSGSFNPHLPVVIPRTPPAMAFPDARVVPGHWLILVAVIASSAVGVLGAKVWPYPGKAGDAGTVTLPQDASHAGDDIDRPSISSRLNRPAAAIASETCRTQVPTAQLVMSMAPLVLHANEAAPLGLRIDGAPEGAQLLVCGFAAKSTISAGHSTDEQTWALPASDVADATLNPPPGFVGVMQLDLVLLRGDRTVADRKTRQMQWQPQVPDAAATTSPLVKKPGTEAEIERQLEEAKSLEAAGNLSLARSIFLRLAQAGYPHAAFLYADSYDPISLAKRQLLPPDSDLALSRIWYRKAYDLGSQEANARLERLSNW
jgi:hypothetical protein